MVSRTPRSVSHSLFHFPLLFLHLQKFQSFNLEVYSLLNLCSHRYRWTMTWRACWSRSSGSPTFLLSGELNSLNFSLPHSDCCSMWRLLTRVGFAERRRCRKRSRCLRTRSIAKSAGARASNLTTRAASSKVRAQVRSSLVFVAVFD